VPIQLSVTVSVTLSVNNVTHAEFYVFYAQRQDESTSAMQGSILPRLAIVCRQHSVE